MKCPKCFSEVEKGNLYCPNCLAEIPWVQEFDSVETQLNKKKLEEPSEEELRYRREQEEKRQRIRRLFLVLSGILAVLCVVLFYNRTHTFEAFYEKGAAAYDKGRYDVALGYIEEALKKEPESMEANLLLSRIQEEEGDLESALLVMRPMLSKYPDSLEVYGQVLHLLEIQGETEEIKSLLASCDNQEILEAFSQYVCKDPVSSLPPGTYTASRVVTLSADYERIYYTLDGSEPTEGSTLYTAPILLHEGSTELKAVGINEKNISSNVITRKYVIVVASPDPPEISPESGDYEERTMIEITVPEGCRAYYAFDALPTLQSTEYETPILMPEGYHVFNAILVAANGKVSERAYREYYLQY